MGLSEVTELLCQKKAQEKGGQAAALRCVAPDVWIDDPWITEDQVAMVCDFCKTDATLCLEIVGNILEGLDVRQMGRHEHDELCRKLRELL